MYRIVLILVVILFAGAVSMPTFAADSVQCETWREISPETYRKECVPKPDRSPQQTSGKKDGRKPGSSAKQPKPTAVQLSPEKRYLSGDRAFDKQDYAEARAEFERACKGDWWEACTALGYLSFQGLGGESDKAASRKLFELSCSLRDPTGCQNLGIMLLSNKGEPSNLGRARLVFSESCSDDLFDGCVLLAALDEAYTEAKILEGVRAGFNEGCKRRNTLACARLGRMFAEGRGGPVDPVSAASTFESGCTAGGKLSCAELGAMRLGQTSEDPENKDLKNLFDRGCAGPGLRRPAPVRSKVSKYALMYTEMQDVQSMERLKALCSRSPFPEHQNGKPA